MTPKNEKNSEKISDVELHTIPKWQTVLRAPKFLRDPIRQMNHNILEYGDTYRFFLGGQHPALFTANPAFIQHILQKQHRTYRKSPLHFDKLAHFLGRGLLTSDGPYWLRQRRLIQPAFHKQRLQGLTQIMQETIKEFLFEFDRKIQEGPVDMYQEMLTLAFRIVSRSIFSGQTQEVELELVSRLINHMQDYFVKEIRVPYIVPWLKISGQHRRAEESKKQADLLLLKLIQNRKDNPETYDDLLQLFLESRYEDTGEPMTNQQILDEIKILFVAGHDTSANALAWTWYLLSQHPEYVTHLRNEVDEQLGKRDPGFVDLPQLKWNRRVLDESMRLFPPAWVTDREAVEDDHFNGIFIAKGTFVVTYLYGAHHHAGYWESPEVFRPERFEEHSSTPAFFPFGVGPRMCIGNNFAYMEMQLLLASMINRYDFELLSSPPVERLALVTLRPKNGVPMRFWRKGSG